MTKEINNVADIIDLEYLQAIQDGLGRIVGITTVLLDPQGVPLSNPTNLHSFCSMMQSSEKGVHMCIKVNAGLIEKNLKTKKPAVVTCANSGLKTAAVPIFLGEKFLGSWLIGQIRMSDIDPDLIEETSAKAGLPKEVAKENFKRLPIINEDEFENILSFLVTISKTLIDLVLMNDMLDKRNDELINLAEQLDRSLYAFKSFIDFTDMGAYLVDFYTGEIIMCNSTYRCLFDMEDQNVEGKLCFELMGFDTFCPFCPREKVTLNGDRPTKSYVWENHNEIADQWLSINTRAIPWIDGRLVLASTFIDITGRKKEEERISYLAFNDQRLNIANCVKLLQDINEETQGSQLVCLNVQGLRKINDAYGRDFGDCLLSEIVEWIKPILDGIGSIYRIEGGEFGILLKDCDEKEALLIASEIQSRFDSAWSVDMDGVRQNIYTGVHMGVIKAPSFVADVSTLFSVIERVLSFARAQGKLILFDEEMNRKSEIQLQFEIELKECVLNGMQGFSLHYQPIVETHTGRWVGLEALCRWVSPTLGPVSPEIFIDEVERLGLIDIHSGWVMEQSVRQIKEWGLDKLSEFILDVNLSPSQLRDRELVTKVSSLLRKFDYPVEKFSLEITETSEVQFDESTIKLLEGLKKAGVSLSLDDFGSGYASFSNLNHLPVDCLKTDRSFIKGIEEDAFLQQTLRTMLELAKAAGLDTIAEGVETKSQLDAVCKNGVDKVQGFYYSKPLSAEDLSQKLASFYEEGKSPDHLTCEA